MQSSDSGPGPSVSGLTEAQAVGKKIEKAEWERDVRAKLQRLAGEDISWLLQAARAIAEEPESVKKLVLEMSEDQARRLVQKAIDSALSGSGQGSVGAGGALTAVLEQFAELMDKKLEPIRQAIAEHASHTVGASTISEYQLQQVRAALNVILVPLSSDGQHDALDRLLQSSADKQPNHFWSGGGQLTEPAQRTRYSEELKRGMPASTTRLWEWIDAKDKVQKVQLGSCIFPVSGKNDELLIVRRFHSDPSLGALLGVEVKKQLTNEALRQAELEFYIWANQSYLPFAQLVTDLGTGGVIFYCRRSESKGGSMELVRHVLVGLDAMYSFANNMILQISPDVGADDAAQPSIKLPDDLPAPKRVKLCQQLVKQSAMSAGELLAKIVRDRDDIACMRDVEDLPMDALSIRSLPPYSLSYFS